MLFKYKAKLKNGEIFEGTMDSTDRLSLSRELRSRGNIPISITEQNNNSFNFLSVFQHFFSKVKNEELIIFTKNLSGMLKAGLSLFRALSVLKKQTKNVVLNKILTSLSDEINAGGTLSSGLVKFPDVFSKLFI